MNFTTVTTARGREARIPTFAAPPIKRRRLPGRLERATNDYQRELVSIYDRWSARAERAIVNAQRDGLGPARQAAILMAMLGDLEDDLVRSGRTNLVEQGQRALRGPFGRWQGHPAVLSAIGEQIRNNEQFIRTSLMPDIAQRVRVDLMDGVATDRQALRASFDRLRYRPAQYAGAMYATVFEAGKAAGELEDSERERSGLRPIAVRWDLDASAEHCADGAGTFGCPTLQGVYEGGVRSLPTVPGGLTTCRSNCRCVLSYYDPESGQWERVA